MDEPKKKYVVSDLMDQAFKSIEGPGKKILKQAVGMVITGMSREKQQSNDPDEGGNYEILNLELDGFAVMEISVRDGQVTIQTLPSGKPRMSLEDKIAFLKEPR